MESSIFTAEARAIDQALNIISKSKRKKFLFSDSLSVLLSLRNKKFQNPLIIKLLSRLDSMSNRKGAMLNNYILDPKPHWSEREWKSRLGSQIGLRSDPQWNQQLLDSFTQNGNNDGEIRSTINSSKFNQPWECRDQHRENQEENKSLYPDCELVIQV